MNPQSPLHDDPRLTAYALGELTDDEAREVEAWMATSDEARELVAEVRGLKDSLTAALQHSQEPLSLSEDARKKIEQTACSGAAAMTVDESQPRPNPRRLGAKAAIWISALSLLLAAGLFQQIRSLKEDAQDVPSAMSLTARDRDEQLARQQLEAARDASEVAAVAREEALRQESRALSAAGRTKRDFQSASGWYETASQSARELHEQEGKAPGNTQPTASTTTGPAVAETPSTRPGVSGRSESKVQLTSPEGPVVRAMSPATHPEPPSFGFSPVSGGVSPISRNGQTAPADNRGGYPAPVGPAIIADGDATVPIRASNGPVDSEYGATPAAEALVPPRTALHRHPEPVPPTRPGVPERHHRYHIHPTGPSSNESYQPIIENEFRSPTESPLSTFSIDVDTGAYANVRRFLNHGQLPPQDAVRIEELVNYFEYSDASPDGEQPFSATLELGTCPWDGQHRLLRIGLKGREIDVNERPPSNLVFLLDVSGSMRPQNKLPLVKQAMRELAQQMREDDQIAIVTYAGQAGLVLPSTTGDQQQRILSAIDGLSAGGSTNGEAGIRLAYEQAVQHFVEDGSNRVILCSDGDFNVGLSSDSELVQLIEDKARHSGVFLSVFGFGMGNLKDSKLEQLADHGNGHYGYIDALAEAQRVFGQELVGTLYTIAKDVKIQIEFNPAHVGAYRLIGYENRVMSAEDFNDDRKDAGEIGAGHSVTALYEIIPSGVQAPSPARDDLKYQPARPKASEPSETVGDPASPEWLTVKVRYKQPDGQTSAKLEFPLVADSGRVAADFDWAAAVAGFGLLLRDSRYKGSCSFPLVQELAIASRGADPDGRRAEFIGLVHQAHVLYARQHGLPTPVAPEIPEVRQQADER